MANFLLGQQSSFTIIELRLLCWKLKTAPARNRSQVLDDLIRAIFHTDATRRPPRASDGTRHHTPHTPAHYGRTRKIQGKRANLFKKCQQLYAANNKWLTDKILDGCLDSSQSTGDPSTEDISAHFEALFSTRGLVISPNNMVASQSTNSNPLPAMRWQPPK